MLRGNAYFCVRKLQPLIPKRIVITGGPGTGKSTIIHNLEAAGYFCFHEVIRTMTMEAKKQGNEGDFATNPLAFVSDPREFNQRILDARVRDFQKGTAMNASVVFYDRGIPDVLAYMDFFNQKYNRSYVDACENYIYDAVLLLPPWEEIYVSDNERLESFEEATRIHEYLENTYRKYGYSPILIPEATVEERTAHILKEFNLI